MAAATLRTMAPFKKLQKAGFTQPQACAILNAALETHNTTELATKHNLEIQGVRFDYGMDKVRTDLSYTINTAYTDLSHRIDKVSTNLDYNIDKVSTKLDYKIDKISTNLDYKIDKVSADLNHRIDNLHKDFGHLASTLSSKLTIRLGAIVLSLPFLTKFLHLPLP